MSDIGRWLEAHRLGKYTAAFIRNDIGLDVLPDLEREDLKELGVSLGDGKRLLKAARALAGGPAPTASEPGYATAVVMPTAQIRTDAERRQLTVMFADLVGSTELSRQLDPEDLRKINRSYQGAAKAAIEQCGGYIARYMGDGVLAYFGYPQAREDDAERALRAGLTLTETVPTLRPDAPLAVRVGIATGPVVVGDLIGEGASQENAVVGETPNLAARLEGLADPNTVVISEATQALTAGLFELEALPAQTVKGFSKEVIAFRVRAEARGRSRFAARSGSALSPFVGREEEFELLVRRWSRACKGEGQVVLVVGEPGIGKSRLLQQLQAEIGAEGHERIFLQCSPYHEASAHYPTIAAFERILRFAEIVGDAKRLAALEQHLRRIELAGEQTLGLLAYLLAINTERRFPAVDAMDAGDRRERTLRALVDYVRRLAKHAPLLCAFEDVHWADPTTRELLGRLVETVGSTSALLITTSRPGFEARWADLAHVQVMSLSRLRAESANQLVDFAAEVSTLPDDVVTAVLDRAEGNPLFIEELTRTVVQSSEAVTGDRAIPATLQDSLMARIDATGAGKSVAQYAAVVGRTFESALLIEIWESDSALLFEGLNALEQAGLLTREGAGELTRHAFKHALIRDAAYDSLLREDRRRLHARVAEAMVSLNSSIRSSQPELLAHHFSVAEEYEVAIRYWQSAGERDRNRSANNEALANFSRGLALLERLPESSSRDRKELSIRVAMIAPIMAVMGQGSQGMQDAVTGALTLSDRIGNTPEIFPVLFAHCIFHGHRARHREALAIARDIDRRARLQSDVVPRLVAHRVLGYTNLCLGELNTARRELEQAVALYDEDHHVALTLTYGIDAKSLCLGYLSWIAWYQGAADRAMSLARAARQHAQNIGHVTSLGTAYWLEGILAASMRDPGHLRGCSAQLLALGDEHGRAQWILFGRGFSDFADVVERADDSAAIRLAAHIKARIESGFLCFITVHFAELAAAQAEMGWVDDALETLNEATDIVEQGGERFFEAELCRARGLVEAQRNRAELASESFLRALQIAREQGNRLLELRAAASLARHWSETGRPAEAFALLQPIYGGFSEGFNAADLRQAKSLLEELK